MAVTLVEFLLARVGEDEADARRAAAAAYGHLWVVTGMDNAVGVDYDPARVLAECQARRAIIELHELVPGEHKYRGRPAADPADTRVCHEHDGIYIAAGPCETLRLLAQPFKDHPDFLSEWLQD